MNIRIVLALSALAFASNGFSESKYDSVVQFTNAIHAKYPDTEVFSIPVGNSSIVGIKIGSGSVNELVLATHHGNEYGSTEVAKAAMESLAAHPIKGRAVYMIPVVNVSGYNNGTRAELGIDPNRDWPGPCGSASGGPFRLKSIKAISDFMKSKNFTTAVTLHTYASVIAYPWSFNYNEPTLYDQEFEAIAQKAASFNSYNTGKTPDLLYTTRGDFESSAFWTYGTWSFLIELGTSHNPNSDEIKKMIAENVPAIRSILETAPEHPAANHSFTGTCSTSSFFDDLGIE